MASGEDTALEKRPKIGEIVWRDLTLENVTGAVLALIEA